MSSNQQTVPEPPSHTGGDLGVGRCPMVLGECVQGQLAGELQFLITSPINCYSRAEFAPDLSLPSVVVEPAERTKSRAAVTRYLEGEGLHAGGLLKVHTPLEPSHGFGTSTADITASIRAAAAAWGRPVSPRAISRIAASIEPTDGSMYRGAVAYAHRAGILLERLGQLPSFNALIVSGGEGVDTVAFDEYRKSFRYTSRDEHNLLRAWEMIRLANRRRDVKLMAAASTISAHINEQFMPKPPFKEMLRLADRVGAEGLMAAHSGTVLALILNPLQPNFPKRREQAIRHLDGLFPRSWVELTNY